METLLHFLFLILFLFGLVSLVILGYFVEALRLRLLRSLLWFVALFFHLVVVLFRWWGFFGFRWDFGEFVVGWFVLVGLGWGGRFEVCLVIRFG